MNNGYAPSPLGRTGGINLIDAAEQQYQSDLARYNQQQQSNNNLIGTLASVGGTILGGAFGGPAGAAAGGAVGGMVGNAITPQGAKSSAQAFPSSLSGSQQSAVQNQTALHPQDTQDVANNMTERSKQSLGDLLDPKYQLINAYAASLLKNKNNQDKDQYPYGKWA